MNITQDTEFQNDVIVTNGGQMYVLTDIKTKTIENNGESKEIYVAEAIAIKNIAEKENEIKKYYISKALEQVAIEDIIALVK